MIDIRKLNDFLGYAREQEGPKISLHLKTHRAHPDNRADPINYKNAVQNLQRQLIDSTIPRRDWESAIKAMEALHDDQNFWEHTQEGIVVLAAGERMEVFQLQHSVQNLHRYGKHFHLLPLFHLDEILGYVYLVDLSRDRFSMYLVNPLGSSQVATPEIKQSFPELFDDFDANANLRVGGFGGKAGMHYGHRARPEEVEKDRGKYFRYLADSFTRLHKETGMHFVLAGTTENIAHFRQIMGDQKYLDGTIPKPLDAMDDKAILKEVTAIMRPLEVRELGLLATELNNARSGGKAATVLGDMLTAAREGRIGKLVAVDDIKEDQLDAMAEVVDHALQGGADILVVNPKDRPLELDYSAILRY